MLPKKNRLSLQSGLFLKNKKLIWRGKLFNLFTDENGPEGPLVAIIVPNKIAPKSTLRHKVKRRVAAAIRPFLQDLAPQKILIYAQREIITKNAKELEVEMNLALTKIKR